MLLQRRFVNAGLRLLQAHNWKKVVVSEVARIYREGPFHPTSTKVSNAIRYHVLDVFLTELKKALPFDGPVYQLHMALCPIIEAFSTSSDKVVRKRAQLKVLDALLAEMLEAPHLAVFRKSAAALAKEWFQIGADPEASHTKRIFCYKLVGQLTQAFKLQDLDLVSSLGLQKSATSASPILTFNAKKAAPAVAPEPKEAAVTHASPKKVKRAAEALSPGKSSKKAQASIAEPAKAAVKPPKDSHLELAASAGFKVSDLPETDVAVPLPKDGEVDPLSQFRVLSLKPSLESVLSSDECVATHEVFVEDIVSDADALANKKVRWGLERNHVQSKPPSTC